MRISLNEIAVFLGEAGIHCIQIGDGATEINGFSSLDHYKPGTLTWLKSKERADKSCTDVSLDMIAVVQEKEDITLRNAIISNESKRAFFAILDHFFSDKREKPPIGPGSYLSEQVVLGKNVIIGANCVIDGDISIGNGTVIEPGVVVVGKVTIGNDCYVQAGVCIGVAGYGYVEDDQHHKTMIHHYGGVEVGNRVFIGSHTNIARGTIDNTIIEDGVKIAPSTHIGHNNHIMQNASVVCSTLYGSVVTGRNAYISASLIRNQISIGDDSIVGMGSLVTKDVEPGVTVVGSPAKPLIRNK